MNVSKRAGLLPASSIRKLIPYSDAAKSRGIHVFHLNIGQPDIKTPDTFLHAIRNYQVDVLEYGPSNGLLAYRKGLVKYYAEYGVEATENEIFITTAGSEALLFAMLGIADPGDNVLVMEPYYTNYNGFGVIAGIDVIGVPTRAEDGFAIPSVSEFASRINTRTKGILLCNPNNPTGAVYSRESLKSLVRFAVERNLYLISDEVYREFTYDGLESTSILTFPELGDRAILVDSVSKRYSACGARIGCIVTHNKPLLNAIMRMGQARLCPPTIEQVGALAALDTPSSYMAEVIEEYQMRRDVLYEGLRQIPGVFCQKPCGAFYMMVNLPVDDADDFARFMLENFQSGHQTVMVAPGSGFYSNPDLGKHQVRVAYVLRREDLERSSELLAAGLEAYRSLKKI